MKIRHTITILGLTAMGAVGASATAYAQSGHFIEGGSRAPDCDDVGTQVECDGKVAGLGGTTFEVQVTAPGVAEVECENHGGNVAPGQDTSVNVAGTTGPQPTPRNGQYTFTLVTADPEPLPAVPTCPNPLWTPHIVDVTFGVATLTLLEDCVVVDTFTTPVD